MKPSKLCAVVLAGASVLATTHTSGHALLNSITNTRWEWQRTINEASQEIVALPGNYDIGTFTITFKDDGGFIATTNCGTIIGKYRDTNPNGMAIQLSEYRFNPEEGRRTHRICFSPSSGLRASDEGRFIADIFNSTMLYVAGSGFLHIKTKDDTMMMFKNIGRKSTTD